MSDDSNKSEPDLFAFARWYDVSINWQARLNREAPVLREVFGPPGKFGLLDAACGPGRHLAAMIEAGYRVTGLDCSPEMLEIAREHLGARGLEAPLIEAPFDRIPPDAGPFDGIYCLGNSLAATGSAEHAERSIAALASVLAPGGRLFVQLLNFEKLRAEKPRVRGPRVCHRDGIDYISSRVYMLDGDIVEVTNVTHWNDDGWKQFARSGILYAISPEQITRWSASAGLTIESLHGGYDRRPFDPSTSGDLIIVATRDRSRMGAPSLAS